MKKYLLLLIFLLSCKTMFSQECQAWFWFESDSINSTIIHFHQDSFSESEILDFNWDFGDGNTSSEISPSHEYQSEGDFLVSLTINSDDCNSTFEEFVFISNNFDYNCFADFFYEYIDNNYLTINFIDMSFFMFLEDVDWLWEFGDGTISSEQNPIHNYSESGIYNVSLTIFEEDCQSTISNEVYVGEDYYIGDECFAMFSFEQISPGGLTFQFYDASWTGGDSIASHFWDFGTGDFSNGQNPIYTFPYQGEFLVTHIVESEFCSNAETSVIYTGDSVWYPENCQALFWIEPAPENEYQLQFFDFSYVIGEIMYWEWNFGDGGFAYSQNPIHTYQEDGTYFPSLTILSDSCESYIEFEVEIPFYNTESELCNCMFYSEISGDSISFYDLSSGNPTNWYWNFGDGTFSTLQNPNHVFDELGIHEIAMSIGGNGCNNTTAMSVNLDNSQILYLSYPGNTSDIDDINKNETIVYPNPVINNLNLSSEYHGIAFAEIIDVSGKKVLSKSFDLDEKNISIDISKIPQGVYLLKITYSNKTIGTYKIVK